MTQDEMDLATSHLATKSAKIRVLDKLGATRSEIATYLQIRYQHVRNVLVAPPPSTAHEPSRKLESAGNEGPAALPLSIEDAKRGLAAHFGVRPDAIEITIRG